MPEEEKRFTLRLNAKLFEAIKMQAKLNRRSVAKEIEFILFQNLGLDPDPKVQGNWFVDVDGKEYSKNDLSKK